jgi:hypothetical protein
MITKVFMFVATFCFFAVAGLGSDRNEKGFWESLSDHAEEFSAVHRLEGNFQGKNFECEVDVRADQGGVLLKAWEHEKDKTVLSESIAVERGNNGLPREEKHYLMESSTKGNGDALPAPSAKLSWDLFWTYCQGPTSSLPASTRSLFFGYRGIK